jgi:hypothetical protein
LYWVRKIDERGIIVEGVEVVEVVEEDYGDPSLRSG